RRDEGARQTGYERQWPVLFDRQCEASDGSCELVALPGLPVRAGQDRRRPFARFRDTFAVELLQAGVPLETVSMLLGHSSVKITEKHYKPWVKALQRRLEDEVKRAWVAIA